MKAIVREGRGKDLSNMKVRELPEPKPQKGQVIVKMAAARINPADLSLMKGMPGLKFTSPQIGGIDGAGTILESGDGTSPWKAGDKVFVYRKFSDIGTWAEKISIPSDWIAKIPESMELRSAGSISLNLTTAYDCLQELQPETGEKILIHGAGGGVGFMAILLSKAMGLRIFANCSSRDFEKLKQAGISNLIDYKRENFEDVLREEKMDYILDVIGGDTLIRSIRMKPKVVVSTAYSEVNKLHKAGIEFPAILKWIMKLVMSKYPKTAREHSVELIGQITGPNGKLTNQASALISPFASLVKTGILLSIEQIEKEGFPAKSLGNVISF